MTGEEPLRISKKISHWVGFCTKVEEEATIIPKEEECRRKEYRMTSVSVSWCEEERSLWRLCGELLLFGANKEG